VSVTALPVGLPPGFALDSAQQIQERRTFPAVQSTLTLTVPGGEAWLMQSVRGKGTRVASATQETLRFQIRDESGHVVASVDMPQALGSGVVFNWTFAAGINTTATEFASNVYSLNQSLPLVIAPATYQYVFFLDGAAGNDTILETGGGQDGGVYLSYTRWYYAGTVPGDDQGPSPSIVPILSAEEMLAEWNAP
jgi:hypothetical protein